MGGKERCEAKVRQMVADNEDVEGRQEGGGQQAALQPGSPQRGKRYEREPARTGEGSPSGCE